MPTYEYKCRSCEHQFEVFQPMADAPLKICPECGKEINRVVGGGLGIIFKGSGFYVTDNKKSSTAGSFQSTSPAGAAAPAGASSSAGSSSAEGSSAASSSAAAESLKIKTESKAG
jgi:putative FmdB family regulatory protein